MFERCARFMLALTLVGAPVSVFAAEVVERNPLGSDASVVTAGREIYNQSCTVCHGVDGGPGDRGPALAASRSYVHRSDAQLFAAVRAGIPGTGMPATGLSDEDSWRVVAYIRSLRAKAADFPVEGDVHAGEVLFWGGGGCGRCHMVGGRGGLLGPDLTNVGGRLSLKALQAAMTVAKPHPPVGYEPVTIRTVDGETIRGVLKNRHNFSYQLLGEDGRLHLLTGDEVESVELAEESLMPSDWDRRLTAEEFRDLLAFVTRLAR